MTILRVKLHDSRNEALTACNTQVNVAPQLIHRNAIWRKSLQACLDQIAKGCRVRASPSSVHLRQSSTFNNLPQQTSSTPTPHPVRANSTTLTTSPRTASGAIPMSGFTGAVITNSKDSEQQQQQSSGSLYNTPGRFTSTYLVSLDYLTPDSDEGSPISESYENFLNEQIAEYTASEMAPTSKKRKSKDAENTKANEPSKVTPKKSKPTHVVPIRFRYGGFASSHPQTLGSLAPGRSRSARTLRT